MNIRFKHIELSNFLSFKFVSFDLDNQGFIAVKGKNENSVDNASSNGSGKSALFDGIFWILTGETIRGSKDVANIFINNGVNGKLLFNVDGVTYYIIRAKDDPVYKTNLKIFKNDEDISGKGIRDSEKILVAELPDLTGSLLGAVVLLGQGLPQRFSNNTPAGRKEVLETLSKSDFMIEDLKNRFTRRKTWVATEQRRLEDALLKSTTLKESLDKQLINLNSQKDSVVYISDIEYAERKQQLESYILQTEKDIEAYINLKNSYVTDLRSIQDDSLSDIRNQQLTIINEKYQNQIDSLTLQLAEVKTDIKYLCDQIDQLDSVKEYCPLCKQKLPDVHKVDTTDLKNEVQHKKVIESDLEIKLQTLEDQRRHEKTRVEDQFKQEKQKKQNMILTLEGKIQDLDFNIKQFENQKNEYIKLINQLESQFISQSTLLESIDNQIISIEQDLENIQNEILYINNEVEKIKSRQSVLSQINSILTRDFRGVLLTNVIDYIQSRCIEYSRILFNTQLIKFTLDGNKLCISYDGKEYELLSGGERQKIDIIVQFSLRDMLCKFLNFSSNILVLDEILDNLDEDGSQRVLDLITTSLNDVECVYVISHRHDFVIPFDKELVIIKGEDKISRLS